MEVLRSYRRRARELESARETMLASLAEVLSDALDDLSSDERNEQFRRLHRMVTPVAEGFEASEAFCSVGPTPGERIRPRTWFGALRAPCRPRLSATPRL